MATANSTFNASLRSTTTRSLSSSISSKRERKVLGQTNRPHLMAGDLTTTPSSTKTYPEHAFGRTMDIEHQKMYQYPQNYPGTTGYFREPWDFNDNRDLARGRLKPKPQTANSTSPAGGGGDSSESGGDVVMFTSEKRGRPLFMRRATAARSVSSGAVPRTAPASLCTQMQDPKSFELDLGLERPTRFQRTPYDHDTLHLTQPKPGTALYAPSEDRMRTAKQVPNESQLSDHNRKKQFDEARLERRRQNEARVLDAYRQDEVAKVERDQRRVFGIMNQKLNYYEAVSQVEDFRARSHAPL